MTDRKAQGPPHTPALSGLLTLAATNPAHPSCFSFLNENYIFCSLEEAPQLTLWGTMHVDPSTNKCTQSCSHCQPPETMTWHMPHGKHTNTHMHRAWQRYCHCQTHKDILIHTLTVILLCLHTSICSSCSTFQRYLSIRFCVQCMCCHPVSKITKSHAQPQDYNLTYFLITHYYIYTSTCCYSITWPHACHLIAPYPHLAGHMPSHHDTECPRCSPQSFMESVMLARHNFQSRNVIYAISPSLIHSTLQLDAAFKKSSTLIHIPPDTTIY
jgi:hypothetical protein